ncbi:hypothetical protein HK097_010988 [Rhizophlyctis rosea]|uniref:Uncharacterized protein n=1 Tax=Rhizophlyctis rosea TaxID=64517 RepID=A0AAD5SA19_9FUNG|nr:hypothetical protein HK097_010988 [Rhizophlyctis rosea]
MPERRTTANIPDGSTIVTELLEGIRSINATCATKGRTKRKVSFTPATESKRTVLVTTKIKEERTDFDFTDAAAATLVDMDHPIRLAGEGIAHIGNPGSALIPWATAQVEESQLKSTFWEIPLRSGEEEEEEEEGEDWHEGNEEEGHGCGLQKELTLDMDGSETP